MNPKGRIKIDRDLCKGCGYCVDACPFKVITVSARFNRQGYFPAVVSYPEKCTGCAVCSLVCPDVAITVYRRDRKKKGTRRS